MSNLKHIPINEIAKTIEVAWKPVSPCARPYLNAMKALNQITDVYGLDSARSVVSYFLANAQSFRGHQARLIKAQLKCIVRLLDENEELQNLADINVMKAYEVNP